MWASVNTCALLVGLAAFAGWTLYRFSVPPGRGWVHRRGGVGILALFFSIVSPEVVIIGPGPDGVFGTSDDDIFQLQLIRPATPSVTISTGTRVARRRSLTGLWINTFVATATASWFHERVALLSPIGFLNVRRTSRLQSRSIPHQLLHDFLAISILYLVARCPSSVGSGGISRCKSRIPPF